MNLKDIFAFFIPSSCDHCPAELRFCILSLQIHVEFSPGTKISSECALFISVRFSELILRFQSSLLLGLRH